jgi:hypothetical protein
MTDIFPAARYDFPDLAVAEERKMTGAFQHRQKSREISTRVHVALCSSLDVANE